MSHETSPDADADADADAEHTTNNAVTGDELKQNPTLGDGLTDMQAIDVYVRAQLALDLVTDTHPQNATKRNLNMLRFSSITSFVEKHPALDADELVYSMSPENSYRVYKQLSPFPLPATHDCVERVRTMNKIAFKLNNEAGTAIRDRAAYHLRNPHQYVFVPDE